jgi:Flp pilus assembly secretin CpaC
LLIKAMAPGTAEVWIWKKDSSLIHLSVLVQPQTRPATSEDPLGRALAELREASTAIAGERVILRGMIHSEEELARIHVLEDAFPKQVENHTEPSAELLARARLKLESWIREQRLEAVVRLESLGSQIWIRGTAPDVPTRAGWEQKLRSLFAAVHIDLSTLPDAGRTLFFRVFLLEMKQSAFRQLGLEWPSHLSGSLQVEGGSLYWAHAPSIDLTLRWLEGQGWAKILSQPELVVRVPGEAELFNGGEIPIEVRPRAGNRGGSWVDWKSYGLTLKIRALQSTSEQVRLEISSEMSELDRANGTETVPALQSSRVRSQVDARIGEPLFLSGLLQEKSGNQERGLPFLSKIPVLGRLFGFEDTIRNRSELVAVLVPLNAPPPSPRREAGRVIPEALPRGRTDPPAISDAVKPLPIAGARRTRDWFSPLMERGRR